MRRVKDNFELYGFPREDSGYKTPGIEEEARKRNAYLIKMADIIFTKRGLQDQANKIVTK